ncbi:MAG: phosphoribosylformylglycinamidine synthase I [Chloroflexi bacterium]|nr:phosphoribosylformylglycinamidine synthase I [Chloroflexota bacterium]MBI3040068.1 phosphoribosylformylglycinamidine synthase I [Chloroflexota bacterium]MBI3931251.1 phosphoribosylformylglycinamidine synthase I [Chloroflexota bacterium]
MGRVRTLILRAPGTNCDAETMFAFQQAGAEAALVHVNQLIRREERLADYQVMVVPGGFTYGDDIAAGKVLANELRLKLGEDITRFVEDGKLILGICNGFQALVKAGFLPELKDASPRLTLTNNDSGKFECRWVYLGVHKPSPCVFTRGIDRLYLPVAHGEGKLVVLSGALTESNIALFYTDEQGDISAGYPHNPSGSAGNVAGICDSSGRVFALMPHPERHIRGTQHPQWTRLGARQYGDGFQIFRNAVEWAKNL